MERNEASAELQRYYTVIPSVALYSYSISRARINVQVRGRARRQTPTVGQVERQEWILILGITSHVALSSGNRGNRQVDNTVGELTGQTQNFTEAAGLNNTHNNKTNTTYFSGMTDLTLLLNNSKNSGDSTARYSTVGFWISFWIMHLRKLWAKLYFSVWTSYKLQ